MGKLNKREMRARTFIAEKVEYMPAEGFILEVEWKRSATWGSNPHVYTYEGDDCLDVSGCGYCKLSTAVANMLRHLPDLTPEESSAVWALGGTGMSHLKDELVKRTGGKWRIEVHYCGKGVDVYRVSRAGVVS